MCNDFPKTNYLKEQMMASGDRQRTWFPEMLEILRAEWRPDLPWDELIALRDRLEETLRYIRKSRNLKPVKTSTVCPKCGKQLVQGGGPVSVRAAILAVKRFGIAPDEEVKSMERGWSKYRKETAVDLYGKPSHGNVVEAP